MKWNSVAGYEGLYEVSDTGEVRSLDRYYTDSIGRHTHKLGHKLTRRINTFGYERVALTKNNETKEYFVHRLVGEAFVENKNNYPFINHKDENKLNNNADNLEWCTSKYNDNYGTRNERMKNTERINNSNGKPIIATTADGKEEYYNSSHEAGRILKYPHTGISNMLKSRTHTACGRTWRYAEEDE